MQYRGSNLEILNSHGAVVMQYRVQRLYLKLHGFRKLMSSSMTWSVEVREAILSTRNEIEGTWQSKQAEESMN